MRASDDHVVVSFDDWYNQDNQDRRWHDFSSLYAQFLDKAHVASEIHLSLEDVLNQQRERRVHFYSQKCCYVLLHADQLVGFLVFEYFEKIPGDGGKKRRIDEREEWPDDFIYLAQVYAPGKGGHLLHWLFDQYPQTPVVLEVEKATGSTLKERYKNKYQFFDMLSKDHQEAPIYKFVFRCLHSGDDANNPTCFPPGDPRLPTIDGTYRTDAWRWLVRPPTLTHYYDNYESKPQAAQTTEPAAEPAAEPAEARGMWTRSKSASMKAAEGGKSSSISKRVASALASVLGRSPHALATNSNSNNNNNNNNHTVYNVSLHGGSGSGRGLFASSAYAQRRHLGLGYEPQIMLHTPYHWHRISRRAVLAHRERSDVTGQTRSGRKFRTRSRD